MTVNFALPTAPEPYLGTGELPADFYSYEELLSDSEKEKIGRIRDFLRTEASPIVDDYWARAEFPFQLIEGFAKLGPAGLGRSRFVGAGAEQPDDRHHCAGDGARRSVAVGVLRRALGAGDGQHPSPADPRSRSAVGCRR